MKRIAINGFGRIGRAALKVIMDYKDMEIVALNDLMTAENAAYLLKYDSVYGIYERDVKAEGNHLVIGGKKIPFYNEKDPAK
ncbi:MAG: type I glyceraldehyde-3-phosphate dehydrogenase, partial [Bacteroidota bacterium]|nr:type I glyceraldehyde-3-phosphate dehydrogenase [Bacteroidota bacterium]